MLCFCGLLASSHSARRGYALKLHCHLEWTVSRMELCIENGGEGSKCSFATMHIVSVINCFDS